MKLRDDLPTLRMMTLRRLLATVPQPLVVEASTEVAAVEAGLREKRAGVAVVVDNGGVLRGTLQLEDLAACAGHTHADEVMATANPALEPESGLEDAEQSFAGGCRCVLVVASTGQLLGVLTKRDLDRVSKKRAA